MLSPTIVEFLGTALLIGAVSFTGVPVLIVAALAIAIGLGGKISGGHFNPAVTGWALLSGKIGQAKAVSYILAQIAAAVFIWVTGSIVKV
uniref:Major intrinsic protein n=1 Tax=viral metagenome TaxID=1070528 RepID=A0A6C0JRK0_9ZZZZ